MIHTLTYGKALQVLNFIIEPYKVDKVNFIVLGRSNSGKIWFINNFCNLYDLVYVFCNKTNEWEGVNYLLVMIYIYLAKCKFLLSITIYLMGDLIRLPAIEALYSKGRHYNIIIICSSYTITDLSTKREIIHQ